jgi:hypothetical protein
MSNDYRTWDDKSLDKLIDTENRRWKEDVNEYNLLQHSAYYDFEPLVEIITQNYKDFKILSLNIQSINAKFDQLCVYLETLNDKGVVFDAICLQETWLSKDDDTSLLQIHGYRLVPQGKICSNKAGLIIYLHEKYNYNVLQIYDNSDIWEAQFITVYNDSMPKGIIIGNMYRPPCDNIENYKFFSEEIEQIFKKLHKLKQNVILAGDFNINLLKIYEKDAFLQYFEMLMFYNYIPKITLPTRFSETSGTLIDNFFM